MLVNTQFLSESSPVKFISYTGRYPNLCRGVLTLEIDGEEVIFGYNFAEGHKSQFDAFWSSGGGLGQDYCPYTKEWEIDIEQIPEQFRKYAAEIDEVFNNNVRHGCCGGCA